MDDGYLSCLGCGTQTFTEEFRNFAPELECTLLYVEAMCYVCSGCGRDMMDEAQMNVFLRDCRAELVRERARVAKSLTYENKPPPSDIRRTMDELWGGSSVG